MADKTDRELKQWIRDELRGAPDGIEHEELCARARAIGVPGHRVARMLRAEHGKSVQANLDVQDIRSARVRAL